MYSLCLEGRRKAERGVLFVFSFLKKKIVYFQSQIVETDTNCWFSSKIRIRNHSYMKSRIWDIINDRYVDSPICFRSANLNAVHDVLPGSV